MPINEYDETLQDLAQGGEPLPKAPAPNPYDQTVEQLDQARETQLRKTIIDGSLTPPERAAQVQKLSQRTGLPAPIVDRNFEDIRKRAALAETPYAEMLRDSPVLSDWLVKKPDLAPVAHDDLEQLGFLEWLTKAPRRAWDQGTAQVRYGMLRNQELYRELTPAEREQLAADKTAMEAGGKLGAGASWFRGAITGSAQNLPNMIGAWVWGLQRGIPAAVAAGTAAAAVDWVGGGPVGEIVGTPTAFAGGMAAGMYVGAGDFTARMESGLAYDEYLAFRDEFGQPLDRRVAKAAALATGYANGTLEAAGLEFLFKSIPGLDKLASLGSRNVVKQALRQPGVRAALLGAVKSYGETLTAEASVEVAQRAVTILSGELAKMTGKTETPTGQTAPGNTNLYQQPTVQNADGSVSTVDSVSINIDGKEVLIPRVTPDGRHLTTEEATAEYRRTGRNLGTFDSPESANAFAEQLHNDYAAGTYDQPGPMRTPSAVLSDLMNEGLGALQSFALTVAPGPIGEFGRHVAQARSAQANVRFFQALGEGVAQSKTGQRLPEALQSFVEDATKDGPVANVYADVDTWTNYWQSKGVDPAAVATEVTGSRDAYNHAVNTGEHLEIPTARYAVKLAATEHNAFWANELRLGPDQMNGREAVVFEQQIAQLAQAQAEPSAAANVKQQIVQQLTAAGYEPATAESYATLYESAFGAMAERAGLDPADVFAQYGLKVQRGEQQAPANRQVEPATAALPLEPAVPTTNAEGQIQTPADAVAESPAGREPAPQGESGGTPPATAQAGAEGGQGAAAASTTPPPALTLPATPHDVARAVAAVLGSLQPTTDEATLAGSGSQVQDPGSTGNDGDAAGNAGAPNSASGRSSAPGRGEQLPGGAPERRSPGQVGSGLAGRQPGGAQARRNYKLPAGYEPRFTALLDGARSLGFTGSDRSLAQLFTAALEKARTAAADLNSFESDDERAGSIDLLKMIADAGGIGIEAEAGSSAYSTRRKGKVLGNGGATGELENMLESLARQGRDKRTGKPMARQMMRSGGLPGVPGIIVRKGGLTADRMREHVQQDPRWQHLENLSDFLVAVDDAIRIETGTSERQPGAGTYSVDSVLAGALNVRPDTDWWNTAPAAENNGSGESAASLEAINRDASMKARGERFVVYDQAGNRRVLIGVDAVDYVAQPGETYGVEGPHGFQLLDDRGGKAPAANVTNLLHEDAILNGDMQGPDAGDVTFDISEFDQGLFDALDENPEADVDVLATGEKQPRLPGAEHVRDQEIAQPEIADLLFTLSPPPVKGEKRKAAELPPSEEYLAAKAKADEASAALRTATAAYRARTIDDDEYLAARQADDEAQAAFDVAFDRERARGRTTTTLFQSAGPLTDVALEQWAEDLKARTGPDLVDLELGMRFDGAIEIAQLGVRRGGTRAGVGTAVMREIIKLADTHGVPLVLRIAESGYSTDGGSARTESAAALLRFYGRLGFAERETDENGLTVLERAPSIKAGKTGLLVPPTERVTREELQRRGFDTSTVYFHQTAAKFVEAIKSEGFDLSKGRARLNDEVVPDGVFFKPDTADIGVGATNRGDDLAAQLPVYLKFGKSETFADRAALAAWVGEHDPEYSRLAAHARAHDQSRSREFDVLWNKLRAADMENRGERAQHKADLKIDEFLEIWKGENTVNAAAARARATAAFKAAGVDTVVIEKDAGSGGRSTKTVIAITGQQVALAEPGQERILFQPFHHGSPHDFDRFSVSKIGTGEKAQAYGWGLYFAENPKVAEEYRRQLSDLTGAARIYVKGQEIGEGPERHGASLIAHNDVREIRAAAKRWLVEAQNGEPGVTDTARLAGLSAIDYWTRLKAFVDSHGRRDVRVERGHTYQVDIDEQHIAKMLDLDAPLAKQTDTIKEAVAVKLRILDYLKADDTGPRQLTSAWKAYVLAHGGMAQGDSGHTIYDELFNGRNAPEAASKELLALGVPGAKYFDEGSRAKRGGRRTRNIVAYDDAIVTMTHKNGTPVSAEERAAIVREMSQGNTGALQQDDRGGRRGFIRFGADRQFNIGLLERADLSTFLHETGHFYLEVFGDLADQVGTLSPDVQTDTQRQLVGDYQALLGWLGVENRGALNEAAHEKFARGFEAYLMEGHAPSVELRSAFARFRSWLVAIYKSLKSLHVGLSDDVRRVLDRMVATDKAIFAAEQEGHVAPMFTTAEAAGMSDTRFGLYRAAIAEASRAQREKLERRVLAEVTREQQAEWKRRRAEIRSQVERDVFDRQVYQALAAMQHGTRPDGTPLLEETTTEPVKLSRARLVELFGADRLKRLPKPAIYTSLDGADPEVVARMFGYSSADELLSAVERAPAAKAVIEHETTQRMLAEHGSILLDGSLHDRAREAVATEEREAVIRAELRALAHLRTIAAPFIKAGDERVKAERDERAYERRWLDAERKLEVAIAKKEAKAQIDALRDEVKTLRARARGGAATIRAAIPPAGVLAEQARQRLAAMRVRDLAPARYWAASRQAAQRAMDTAARQDFSGAIIAKQQELINLHLYRQASDLRDAIEQRVKKIREQSTKAGLARLGLAGDGYLEQYQGLLERFSFTPASQPQLDRRTSLRDWVNEREEAGLPVELPEDVLDEVRRTPYQNLSTEEFMGVADALDNIAHIAQLERRRLKAAADADFFDARDKVVESIGANNVQRPTRLEFTAKDERARSVADWFASHSKLSFLARALDGYQDGGALWDAIVRPLNAAADDEFARNEAAGKTYGDIVRQAYGHENLSAKLFIPAIGNSLSHEARLAVAMQWGNENGRERLTNDPVRKWNRDQVLAILDTLDKRDWDFVQRTWDYLDTFWPAIAEKQKRVTGLEPEKVDALPIETKYGEYKGGYYPLAYDGRLVPRAEQAKAASEAKLAASAAYVRTTTRRGHTETRKRTVRLPVRLDLGVAFEHINQVIHDLTHHEALIDVTRMLRDGRVSQAIVDHAGDVVYQQFTKAVQDIALGYIPGRGILDKAATFMRTGTQLSLLGWNLWTSAQQPLGIFNGAAEVGTKWVARGLKRWLRDAASMENTLTWISEVSPFMRSRTANATQDLNDLRTRLHQPGGWFDRLVRTVTLDAIGKENVVNSYLWHIGVMQRVADVPTWLGAYEKAMATEGAGDEARAIALADQAVRNAQGGGSMVDLAQVQRGSPIARAFMTFYSYGNVVFNQTKDAIGRTSFRSPAQIAGMLGNLSLIYFMPALATVALGHAVGKMTGEEPEDWLADLAREMLGTALNEMVLVRELTGLVEPTIRGYAGPAGARTFELFYRATQQMEQGKLDEGLVKALNQLAGTLLRYPALQVQRTADGLAALEEGRSSNPFVLLFGAPPKNAKQ